MTAFIRSFAARCLHRCRPAAVLVATLVVVTPTSDVEAQALDSTWRVEFTPYFWAAGMSGTVSVNNRPQEGLAVEQSFADIWKVLSFGLMGSLEVQKGRWGGFYDGIGLWVDDEITAERGFSSILGHAALVQQMHSLAGTYRVRQGRSPIDLFAGARLASIGWDVEIFVSAPSVNSAERTFKETKRWVDPYLGARVEQPFGARWSLAAYADVGGFGIASDLATQAMATVRYAFKPRVVGNLGFRVVTDDYDKNGFKYDMMNGGAMLGVSFRW